MCGSLCLQHKGERVPVELKQNKAMPRRNKQLRRCISISSDEARYGPGDAAAGEKERDTARHHTFRALSHCLRQYLPALVHNEGQAIVLNDRRLGGLSTRPSRFMHAHRIPSNTNIRWLSAPRHREAPRLLASSMPINACNLKLNLPDEWVIIRKFFRLQSSRRGHLRGDWVWHRGSSSRFDA